MFLIIGLGNPGKQYEKTRHNVGFMAADLIAETHFFSRFKKQSKFNAELAEGTINNVKTIIAKPQTFMNSSGEAVQKLKSYFNLPDDSLIVIHDELDIELDRVKVCEDGSSAGHNGIKSLIQTLNTETFRRVRIGVRNKKADNIAADKFVLSRFSFIERHKLNKYILPQVLEEVEEIIK